jgi:hypothetical protein
MAAKTLHDCSITFLDVAPGEMMPTIHEYIKEYKQYHPWVVVDTLGKILEHQDGEPTYSATESCVSLRRHKPIIILVAQC